MKPMLAMRQYFPIALAPVALVLLSACSRSAAEAPAAQAVPEVLTAQARAAEADFAMTLPARALAGETAQLYPRATGFVSERLVDLGDHVAEGQVLAVIANPEADQSVPVPIDDQAEPSQRATCRAGAPPADSKKPVAHSAPL